ncbi:MAG: hypothetical protein JJE52_07780 [Acidimicrobiia bacterium]|nr:hypothetical protein [Acidimicrobiia bacterium]
MLVAGNDALVPGNAARPGNDARTEHGLLAGAAIASIAAGAIHAVAAGAHSESRQAMWAFSVLGAQQIAWGVVALVRPSRLMAAAGAGLAIVALGGWAAAKMVGIGFIEGMAQTEAVQWSDGLAAFLALVALAASVLAMLGAPAPATLSTAFVVVALGAALPGMLLAGTHSHGDGEGHGHDDAAAGADHADGEEHAEGDDHPEQIGMGTGDHGDHGTPAVPPQPYDPAMPINLSGVDGVTPQQQAAAENLIAVTLLRLPQFADPAVAEAAGYHSIGDGATGYEHYVNWGSINDDVILDPDAPESLVFQVRNGQKRLVAAMFMLPDSYTLDDVPELGGELTQWHIHDNLCYTLDPVAPKVAGLRTPGGECREGLRPGNENAMIHVWIVPHDCGPFAALEGVGGGAIAAGEERWCDHAHGA